VTAARVCRATVRLPGGTSCNPKLRIVNARNASVEMLAADDEETCETTATSISKMSTSQTMPHTWVEVALNPKKVQSPNWYTRAPTEYGVVGLYKSDPD
jgi:hypothetical protein